LLGRSSGIWTGGSSAADAFDADARHAITDRHAIPANDAAAARMVRAIGWIISGLLGNSTVAVVPRGGMVHSDAHVLA
jgi:hypothetical protein